MQPDANRRRVKRQLSAILLAEDHHKGTTASLATGKCIQVRGRSPMTGMVEIECDRVTYAVFIQDLKDRTEPEEEKSGADGKSSHAGA